MHAGEVALSVDAPLLCRQDQRVRSGKFPNRSRAMQEAVVEKPDRLDRSRLATGRSELDPQFERKSADEGLAQDFEQWPTY